MIKRQIQTQPDPFAPFAISQAIGFGDLVFVSGQAALDENGQVVGAGDFVAQAHCVFANLKKVLEAGGSSLESVLKVTIFLTDMRYFPLIVEMRQAYFSKPYPADSIVQVSALALPDLMLEIEAIAALEA